MIALRNCWYVAGLGSELAEGLLARRILDIPIVLMRSNAGDPIALEDRCPHRFVPLSLGRRCADTIECGYHGLRFDRTGRCVANPHGIVPTQGGVRAFPVVERHQMLWIWLGDTERADPALVPDFRYQDADRNDFAGSYLRLEANYQLCSDNILDLSHIDFVHRNSLSARFTPPEEEHSDVRQVQNTIWSDRFFIRQQRTALSAGHAGMKPGTIFDRSLIVRWDAPACMMLYSGFKESGVGENAQEDIPTRFSHFFTPETETTSHYWFAVAQDRDVAPEKRLDISAELSRLKAPFAEEDAPMLRAQQAALAGQDFWKARPMILKSDAAAVRARRLLSKLMREEGHFLEQACIPRRCLALTSSRHRNFAAIASREDGWSFGPGRSSLPTVTTIEQRQELAGSFSNPSTIFSSNLSLPLVTRAVNWAEPGNVAMTDGVARALMSTNLYWMSVIGRGG